MKTILKLYFRLLFTGSLVSLFLGGCTQNNEQTEAPTHDRELSSESIYQFTGEWQNQNGDTLQLSKFHGKIPVVAMVFTQCKFACTRIVADIKNIEKEIPKDKKDKVVFILVSFDSERDQPARLKEFASEMQLDDRWVLLHGNEADVRELSMLLNVKYKKQPNGDFAHSNGITVLNTQGEVAHQHEGLGVAPDETIKAIKEL
ncbi:MAG: SCO family protein [Cytophagales bacterium CG18_big_fil_WC_8_21_14_2_50_42_9]|nr:MAG: SCO family protein [Cytophagales bacterium CG18_big_fil_WC_8_21_14_2_50_42_9]